MRTGQHSQETRMLLRSDSFEIPLCLVESFRLHTAYPWAQPKRDRDLLVSTKRRVNQGYNKAKCHSEASTKLYPFGSASQIILDPTHHQTQGCPTAPSIPTPTTRAGTPSNETNKNIDLIHHFTARRLNSRQHFALTPFHSQKLQPAGPGFATQGLIYTKGRTTYSAAATLSISSSHYRLQFGNTSRIPRIPNPQPESTSSHLAANH